MNKDRVFYPALTVAISATAFAGFSFTYFGPIIGNAYPPTGTALHVHGWSFFLWYLLFPFQAVLISRKRPQVSEANVAGVHVLPVGSNAHDWAAVSGGALRSSSSTTW